MVINGRPLLLAKPIVGMLTTKERAHGVSHGLGEAGYDIRIKQDIWFRPGDQGEDIIYRDGDRLRGRFTLASAIEEFDMPPDMVGVVHDKSTWARKGLSVRNTVVEPGWRGFLTLELVYDAGGWLHIPAGSGIAQVLFHKLVTPSAYEGKYQGQEDGIVEARHD